MFERDPPDQELVARFRGGEVEALDQLFERYHQNLYDFLYHLVGDEAEAQRLLEAVFIRVARSLPKLPPDREFKPWLYNLAAGEAFALLKRRRWLKSLPETEFAGEAPPKPEAGEVQAEVWRVARRLPAEQRAALALEEQHGFDARGIAVVLGRPEAQVEALLGEARARFGREYDARAGAMGLPRSGEVDAALALEMRARTGRSKSLYGFLPPLILPAAVKNAIKAKMTAATKGGFLASLKSACGCKALAIAGSVMAAAVAVTTAAILFIPCVLQGTPPSECLGISPPVPPPTVVTEVPPTETPYVQQCASGVIFCEDFEDGRADGWELGPGWRVEQESPNYVLSGRGHDWATLLGQEWDDVRVRFRLKLLEGTIHLNVRLGEGRRYFIGFHEDGLYLIKQVGDTFTELAGVEAWHALGRWHEVEIVGWGGHLQVYVDGELELDHTDVSPLRRGTIAFETLEDSHAQVDDIEVMDAGEEPKPPTPTRVRPTATPRPPTPIRPTATPRPPTPVPPTELPPCENDSQFVADVTVPDNTEFDPGTPFEKIWRLRNSGTCLWEAGYELVFVRGEQMSGPDGIPLPETEPGAEVDIGVVLVAPEEPGTYRGDWRLRAPDGELFGAGFYVQIVVPTPVVTPPTSVPPVEVPCPPEMSFWPDDDCVMPGECTVLRWDVDCVEAVYLDGEGVVGHDAREVCLDRTTTYTLHAVSPAGDIERSVTIRVPEVSFRADRETIKQGECTTLRWDVEWVEAVYLDREGVVGHDAREVCPDQTTTYTLYVVTDCGDMERSITVVVSTPAPDTTPPPVPAPLEPGSPDFSTASSVDCPVTLRWNPVSDPSGVVYHVILEVLSGTWQQEASWYPVPHPQQQVFGSHCQMGFYYRWHVRARDGAGNWSGWSNWRYYGVPIP